MRKSFESSHVYWYQDSSELRDLRWIREKTEVMWKRSAFMNIINYRHYTWMFHVKCRWCKAQVHRIMFPHSKGHATFKCRYREPVNCVHIFVWQLLFGSPLYVISITDNNLKFAIILIILFARKVRGVSESSSRVFTTRRGGFIHV